MADRYWASTAEDPDRRRRRGAELLVHQSVPLDLVAEIAVYDEAIKDRVEDIVYAAGSVLAVRVRRDWYF